MLLKELVLERRFLQQEQVAKLSHSKLMEKLKEANEEEDL